MWDLRSAWDPRSKQVDPEGQEGKSSRMDLSSRPGGITCVRVCGSRGP